MRITLSAAYLLPALFAFADPVDAFEPAEVDYCAHAPTDALCPALPPDIRDFDSSFVYHFLSEGAQFPFDNFSWQSFVALNWPVTDDDAPRPWLRYDQPGDVFGGRNDACAGGTSEDAVMVSAFLQSTGAPVIDRNLNYLVYDIRLNGVVADYVRDNGLTTKAGQAAFDAVGGTVDFPQSSEENAASAVVLKAAWKIIDVDRDDAARYFTRPGRIAVAASDSVDGKPRCHAVTLGLVGLHIMRRTLNGNGDQWIWSTFEHRDNAPFADNARDPNSILTHELFPGGCKGPDTARRYAFYDPDCPDCPSNLIEPATWTWAPDPPFARGHAQRGDFGTQLVRCWEPFHGTVKLNRLWQKRLEGTVWANYGLVSTQWRGNYGDGFFNVGEVPRYLTNSVLETYVQADKSGSCLGCHTEAATATGNAANFSFLFERAR